MVVVAVFIVNCVFTFDISAHKNFPLSGRTDLWRRVYVYVCWNVHHCVHMYKCLGSCMHGNVCACARSPALCLLFVYLTVRFVCGGLISICLSASTHTFANENGYTYTHACAHTVKLGKSAHLTILYSYKTSRQQEEKKNLSDRSQLSDWRHKTKSQSSGKLCLSFFRTQYPRARVHAPCLPSCLLQWIIVVVIVVV